MPSPVDVWFKARKWKPFAFQREAWSAYRAGESGLIHASTGTGKTYAAFLGPVLDELSAFLPSPGFAGEGRSPPSLPCVSCG